jgi:periplasmic protein TonB
MSAGATAGPSWANELRDRMGTGRAALWIGAGLLALAAHAGALAWALRAPPIAVADNAPPPAIMIELAAEPEAINTETNEIAEQMQDSAEVQSETVEPVEQPPEAVQQPTAQEIPSEEPVEEIAESEPEPVDAVTPEPEPEPDPIEEELISALENVEVPIPAARPKPPEEKPVDKPEKKEETAKKRPKRETPAPSSKPASAAAAQVTQSKRNAARQSIAGMGFGSVSPAKWQSRLMGHLERRKRYPPGARSRREQGTAYVRFTIDERGNVLSATLARSSGSPELDAEVIDLVRRASPVPAPPPGVNKTITAPVKFAAR